jgi:Xaa-Pro aminopeptidase
MHRQQDDFFSLSFATIAGSGANGAIIHYHPKKETCAAVEKSKMFLCDSGGQYR